LADTGYIRAEWAEEEQAGQGDGNAAVAAAVAAGCASDYSAFHSRSWHKERFARQEDGVAGVLSIAD
jgi:hypothetical protein